MKGVLYVPEVKANVLSIPQFLNQNLDCEIEFEGGKVRVRRDGSGVKYVAKRPAVGEGRYRLVNTYAVGEEGTEEVDVGLVKNETVVNIVDGRKVVTHLVDSRA